MKSIICPAPFSLSQKERVIPDPSPEEALIKINRVGIMTNLLKTSKADVVIDATGNAKAIPAGVQYMRYGGKLVLVGIANTDINFHHPSIHAKETTILCSRNATPADFEFVIETLAARALNMEDYITRKVGCAEIVDQMDYWISPDSPEIKIVTEWD